MIRDERLERRPRRRCPCKGQGGLSFTGGREEDTGQEGDVSFVSQLLCLCSTSQQCGEGNDETLFECSRQVRECLSFCLILQGKAYKTADCAVIH